MSTTQASDLQSIEQAIADVVAVIAEQGNAGEVERTQPKAVIDALRTRGLLRLWTPREYGGSEVGLATFMSAVERLSETDAATGWTFANLAAGGALAAFLPSEGAAEIYSRGPDMALPGSVIAGGQALPESGGYRLTGRWPLSSGCEHGDWLGAVSIVLEAGAPRMGVNGAPDLKVMFLQREDCRIEDTWYSLGLRGSGSSHFDVDGVFVPESRTFSLFSTSPQVQGPLYRIGPLGLFSMALTCVMLGTARAAIDAFVELAKNKTPTMNQTGLAVRPTIHAQVARANALLASARAFLYESAAELEDCVAGPLGIEDAVEARRRLACVHAGESCVQTVNMMFALAGSSGVYTGARLEICLRDIHTASQHLAVSPVWWEKSGQYYFGLGLGMP